MGIVAFTDPERAEALLVASAGGVRSKDFLRGNYNSRSVSILKRTFHTLCRSILDATIYE